MPKSSKKYRIRFELSVVGVLGLAAVALCLFFWMFLLGIWAGQTILLPEASRSANARFDLSAGPQKPDGAASRPRPSAAPTKVADSPAAAEEVIAEILAEPIVGPILESLVEPVAEITTTSFFSLQVGAYSDAEGAGSALAHWRERGFDPVLLEPEEGGDSLYRICVGRFENLADASQEAGRLEENEGVRAFITLIAAGRM